jgi:hypothetical protein
VTFVEKGLRQVVANLAAADNDDVHSQASLTTRWRSGSALPTM